MLFIIWTWTAHNFPENQKIFMENLKKLGSAEPIEPAFCKSGFNKGFRKVQKGLIIVCQVTK